MEAFFIAQRRLSYRSFAARGSRAVMLAASKSRKLCLREET
jgi:hypothetical protein